MLGPHAFVGSGLFLWVWTGRSGAGRVTHFRPPARAVQILLYLAFLLLLLESAAFLLAQLPRTRSRLFSDGPAFVQRIRGAEGLYRQFVAERYDAVLGWDNPKGTTGTFSACRRGPVTAAYLEDRSRRTNDIVAGPPILAFGNSFTRGDEVEDGDSYPAQLARLLGRKVVNHGVGGYGPVQAVLKFQRRAADYPDARTVILGITNDDFFRMLNSYRPVYFPHTAGMFAFQPYMRNGVQRANPNGPEAASFEELLTLARQTFREDYWALAEPRFPYSRALVDTLTRPATRLRLFGMIDPARVPRLEEIRRGHGAVLETFVTSALAAGMAPVVLFMPDRPGLRDMFDAPVQELRARFGARAVVVSVRDEGYRWDQYLPAPHCHPGVYGYGIVAEHAARAVREAEAGRPAP